MWLASSNIEMGGWHERKGGGGIGTSLYCISKSSESSTCNNGSKSSSIREAYHKYSSAIGIVGLMQLLMKNPPCFHKTLFLLM
jgi:hypothetical protein